MKEKARRITVFLLLFLYILMCLSAPVCAEHRDYTADELIETAGKAVVWKKAQAESGDRGFLMDGQFLLSAGSTACDWYAIALGRLGISDNYDGYLAVVKSYVKNKYSSTGGLDTQKSTEWHRIALAMLSFGGDPTDIEGIDLIADGVYDRGKTNSLGEQGINGWIWGLIALDAMHYEIPDGAFYTRDDIITEILKAQCKNGSFAFDGYSADIDITAMAVQALSPYYNSEQRYEYTDQSGERCSATVRESLDRAVAFLSEAQSDDGDFSDGILGCEAVAQVITAICSLGIDPANDSRFIKNGNTLIDGLMKYCVSDGGFAHSFGDSADNPSAKAGESNSMAGEQAICAIAALCRYNAGLRNLYDFRPEMSESLKNYIKELESDIELLSESSGSTAEALMERYLNVPVTERQYVRNYNKLSEILDKLGIENKSESISENIGEYKSGNGTITGIADMIEIPSNIVFNNSDIERFNALPEEMTTEYYAEVITLLEKLEKAENRDELSDIMDVLRNDEKEIERIQKEIESINTEIIENLYPFDDISNDDKEIVKELVKRIEALSEYDRKQVSGYEDVIRANISLNGNKRAAWIVMASTVVVIFLLIFVIERAVRRRRKKQTDWIEHESFDDE